MADLEDARRRSAQEPADLQLKEALRLDWPTRQWWLPVVILAGCLSAWEIGARTGAISALSFPAPSAIFRALVRLLRSGTLMTHLASTLLRMAAGLGFGGAAGLLAGLFMGWSMRLRAMVDPFIAAAHPVPKIAILPLIMLIFGIGESSKVIVIALAAFFPMMISTMAGVRQISPVYFEVAASYGASREKVFTRVVFPGSLPFILSGLRLALNSALLLTIAVELVSSQQGLGAMIWFAWETLRTEDLYATLAVTALLGISGNFLLQWLASRLVPWQVERG
jgi:ABC-type nitrate/sulfonate/bicarbonate transport system permease component